MKRKLVKQGAATLMISLPSKWIKDNKLDKGNEISLIEMDNKLLISSDANETKKELELNLTSNVLSAIRVLITNAYRADYRKIKVSYKDEKAFEIIKELVDDQLLGFEIIKKEKGFCVIESITSPTEEQFDNIFSKFIMNIEETFDITEKFLSGAHADFEKTQNKTKEFDNLCRRIIVRENMPHSDLRLDFHGELMHAQRELYLLLLYLHKNKFSSGKMDIDLLRVCRRSFEMLKECYYTKNLESVERLTEFEQKAYAGAYKSFDKSNPVITHHLMNALRGFYLAASPLAGMFLKS